MLHFARQIINLRQIWIFLPGRCTELQLGLCTPGRSHSPHKTTVPCAFSTVVLGMVAAGTVSLHSSTKGILVKAVVSIIPCGNIAPLLDAPSFQASLLCLGQTFGELARAKMLPPVTFSWWRQTDVVAGNEKQELSSHPDTAIRQARELKGGTVILSLFLPRAICKNLTHSVKSSD